MLTAGSYPELVTKYPRASGAAVFAERAFKKPMLSFLVGFSMLAAGLTSAAGLSLAFSGTYLSTFISVPQALAAVVFLALVALLNARGIRESLRSNGVMTLIELTGLVIGWWPACSCCRAAVAMCRACWNFRPTRRPPRPRWPAR